MASVAPLREETGEEQSSYILYRGGAGMHNTTFIKVAFFDLGGTLIGNNRDWIVGAQNTLVKLRAKHIRLGIISNTDKLSRPEILALLPPDFDMSLFERNLVLFSSEVKVKKPDPHIFLLAIERARVTASECLFCTEERDHITAANHVGMQTVKVRKLPNSDIGELSEKLTTAGMLPV